jgi:hypothetical protein
LPDNIYNLILKLFQLLIKLKKGKVNLCSGKDKKQGGNKGGTAEKQDNSRVEMTGE